MAPKKTTTIGNGLTIADDEMLSKLEEELEPVIARRHLLGGHEAQKAHDLRRRINNRLAPEDPSSLAEEAKAFLDVFAPHVDKVRQRTREREAETERLASEVRAMREERAAEIAAMVKAEDERRRAAARAAVDEVI